MDEVLSVNDASRELKLDPSRIRVLAADGKLDAIKVGKSWVIPRSAISCRVAAAPSRGRPIKAENAWALLALSAGMEPSWVSPQARSRLKDLLRMRGLKGLAPRMSRRAEPCYFRAHPGELKYLLSEPSLMRSGASAAGALGLDLLSANEADGYIPAAKVAYFRKEYGLKKVPRVEANVVLRIVPNEAWHDEFGEIAPLSAVALDLIADPDPRSSQAGKSAMKQIGSQLPKLLA